MSEIDIVKDYRLVSFDLVPSPSVAGAFPSFGISSMGVGSLKKLWDFKVGEFVRWGECVGKFRRFVGRDESAYVEFFWPTVWYQDVDIDALEPIGILDVIAEQAK